MTPSTPQGSQLGPLNPGDVVSAALRLYRDRLKTFVRLAGLAMLWLVAGVLGWLVAIALLAGLGAGLDGTVGAVIGGAIGALVGIVPLLYGSAQYYALASVIGRLCFRDLIHQPETSLEARRQVIPRLGQFLVLGFLLMLAYVATYLGAGIAALVVGGGVGLLSGGVLAALISEPLGAVLGFFIGGVLGVAVLVIVLIWVASRLFIAEVVLAIEPNRDAGGSLGRSWELSQGAIARIQIVFLATFFIQLPIVSITNYLPSILLELLPAEGIAYGIIALLTVALSVLGSIVILPLWQAVKGVLYYDLCSRREGLDLSLRHGDELVDG